MYFFELCLHTFFIIIIFDLFLSLFACVPKFVLLSVCLLLQAIKSSALSASRPSWQSQKSVVKDTHWDFLGVILLLHRHTLALPRLPHIPPDMTNAPYGCLQGKSAYCREIVTKLRLSLITVPVNFFGATLHVNLFTLGLLTVTFIFLFYLQI